MQNIKHEKMRDLLGDSRGRSFSEERTELQVDCKIKPDDKNEQTVKIIVKNETDSEIAREIGFL